MTTPALSALIDCFPDAKITFLTSPDGRRLIRNFHPNIDEIWVWKRSGLSAWFNRRDIMKKLAHSSFDRIFCFETNRKIARLFNGYNAGLHWSDAMDSRIHCADNYLAIVRRACPDLDGGYYARLPVSKEATQRVRDELADIGIKDEDTVIMLHPTYSGYINNPVLRLLSRKHHRQTKHRLWPAANFARLGRMLADTGLPDGSKPKILIDLVPDEARIGRYIAGASGGTITLLLEPPDFERYKALINRAGLVVSCNTGPMHVAAAVNTGVIALFSGKDPVDCGPYMKPGGFSVLRAEDTNTPEAGVAAITVESVYDACMKHLSDR